MAKNRIAPDRPLIKKDTFFAKSKPNFKHKNTFNKNIKPSVSGESSSSKKVANSETTGKAPFDKKAWRLRKYSKKYKLEKWEDKRKKAVLRGYYRHVKDDEAKLDVQKIYDEAPNSDEEENEDEEVQVENENNLNANIVEEKEEASNSRQKKNKAFKKAHSEFCRIKEVKQNNREEALRIKAEKVEALKESRKKKNERYKKLNRKTKKGQPIMKERMEMLLEKIQNNMS